MILKLLLHCTQYALCLPLWCKKWEVNLYCRKKRTFRFRLYVCFVYYCTAPCVQKQVKNKYIISLCWRKLPDISTALLLVTLRHSKGLKNSSFIWPCAFASVGSVYYCACDIHPLKIIYASPAINFHGSVWKQLKSESTEISKLRRDITFFLFLHPHRTSRGHCHITILQWLLQFFALTCYCRIWAVFENIFPLFDISIIVWLDFLFLGVIPIIFVYNSKYLLFIQHTTTCTAV